MVAPSWRSSIFICSSIGQDGELVGTGLVQGGVEARFHHGVEVMVEVVLGAVLHHGVVVVVEVVLGAVLHHGVVVVVEVVLHHVGVVVVVVEVVLNHVVVVVVVVEVVLHHVVHVVVELGVVVHHVVHAWRVMVGVEMLDVGHVANACGAIVGVGLPMVLHIRGACGAITLIGLHVVLRRFILTIHMSLYDLCIYGGKKTTKSVKTCKPKSKRCFKAEGNRYVYTHTKTKTLYGVRYGCGKPNGRTKRKVYCQKWVRSKSHKSKAVITKGIHKEEHTRGTKWG